MDDENIHLFKWLRLIREEIVPPLCVEIFLKDGRNYYLCNVLECEDDSNNFLLRIWDLRAMEHEDMLELKRKMNAIKDRNQYGEPKKIHPKLDFGNLHISKDFIAYVIEWHDQLWPLGDIGFKAVLKKD